MKRNVLLVNLSAALIWLSMYSYVAILPDYAASIGANVVMIGMIGGSYGIMQIILRIPLGLISDKTGKDKLLLIVGFSVLTISAVMFLLAQDAAALLFARATAGAAAAWWVVICATFAQYHPDESQVKAQGVLSAAASIGKVVAAALCAFISMAFDYHATFFIALLAAVVGLAFMFGLKQPKELRHEPAPLKEQLLLIKNKDLLVFSLLAIVSQMACFGVSTTFAMLAALDLGADRFGEGMLMLVFFLAAGLISFFVGSKGYKKLGGKNALALAFALGAVACVPMFYTQNLTVLYGMQAISGVSYGVIQAALSGFVVRCVPARQRGTATGIFQSLFAIGIFLGPVLMGLLMDGVSFGAAYWLMAAVMGAAVFLCYTLIPKKYDKMT